jgi:nicotinamidase-related amidase
MMTQTPLDPKDRALRRVDPQVGLAYGVRSQDRQALRDNLVALAAMARDFRRPIIVSTLAKRFYSSPLMPMIQRAIPEFVAIECGTMNA